MRASLATARLGGESGRLLRVRPNESLKLTEWIAQPRPAGWQEYYSQTECLMSLLDAWSNWPCKGHPFVLADDREVLLTARSQRATVVYRDWEEATSSPEFCRPGDSRLHLGLVPEPFCGDIRNASIYVLLLNPGLGPTDYYGEFRVPEFRAARLRNLRQVRNEGDLPFYMLDPKFSWHGGFAWWNRKFAGITARLADRRSISFAAAQRLLASELASIELVPYHSATFRDSGGWLKQLRSVSLAREFVRDYVVPKVNRSEAIVIATRQVGLWALPVMPGVVQYSGGQTRGAHLTPASPGGEAILRWFDEH